MDSEELEWLMEDYKPIFKGVFPSNRLPKRTQLSYPACCIANYDPAGKPGRHWVAFYLPGGKQEHNEYYDGYGLPPLIEDFTDFLSDGFIYNRVTVQSFGTKTCGLHAVYYLQHRIKGEDIEEIVKTFDSVNKLENDSIVVESLMKKEKNRLFQWNHIFTQTCLPFYPDWFAWLPWGRWMDVTPRIRTRHSPDMRKGPLLLLSRSRQRVVLEVVRDNVDPAWNQFPWVYCHYLFHFL